ncbi:prepilin-type N-terminal cleavage/methylation domain-containing protein [Aquincola sp. S2]|uniref:Type II secretion system protein H n=1 Tax=Pseudaquabacterium terrae TaxID=2732868 RepID=A0ABX2EBJ2_9BURK|nr:GspH/FimT family pseudopilin [Aquabacterium terrae]NRF66142.1 prepilin-type N-terminal cleavage/methylation domain-containing protein [Aquabacterium terrae]
MRHLNLPGRAAVARGLTLIEVMVALVIGALLLSVAGPHFGDFIVNSRMREGAHSLLAHALYAQSEALKRNTPVRLTITPGGAQVTVVAGGAVLRTHTLTHSLVADNGTIDFAGNGMPQPLGTELAVDLSHTNTTCTQDMRCPGLRIDGGGGMRLCGNKLSCP